MARSCFFQSSGMSPVVFCTERRILVNHAILSSHPAFSNSLVLQQIPYFGFLSAAAVSISIGDPKIYALGLCSKIRGPFMTQRRGGRRQPEMYKQRSGEEYDLGICSHLVQAIPSMNRDDCICEDRVENYV
ncbi:hypothetical protein CHS0354_018238 [Potamilus streckersoni]|uniref:Uncharacterized protein n=1 Tax=Potamilus streckersoni TaxID=2493646 RepID=A0AAE0VWF0_9BIVA|nr:hypothetical protein CHS0354_018238 [Potamilus streckersoni]